MLGLTEYIPTWVAPQPESESLVERTFFHRDWMIPILLLVGAQVIQRIDQFGLGYALYRITSDVEKLPFPMAPVGALGTMALAESTEEKQKSWKWRVFSIGGVIGCCSAAFMSSCPRCRDCCSPGAHPADPDSLDRADPPYRSVPCRRWPPESSSTWA
jgi:hypothetical protein